MEEAAAGDMDLAAAARETTHWDQAGDMAAAGDNEGVGEPYQVEALEAAEGGAWYSYAEAAHRHRWQAAAK